MKNEEIEAARIRIGGIICAAMGLASEGMSPGQEELAEAVLAQRDLDALCAAAREPESLVGRRVKLRDGAVATVADDALYLYYVRFEHQDGDVFGDYLERGDFELLEDDNG